MKLNIKTVALGPYALANDGEFAIAIPPELGEPDRQLTIKSDGTIIFPSDISRERALLAAGEMLYKYPIQAGIPCGPEIFARLLDLLIPHQPQCRCNLQKLMISGCQCGCFKQKG